MNARVLVARGPIGKLAAGIPVKLVITNVKHSTKDRCS